MSGKVLERFRGDGAGGAASGDGASSISGGGASAGAALYHLRGAVLEALSPTRCASCERPGSLVCDGCRASIVRIDPALSCTRCGAPYGNLVCTECRSEDGTLRLNAPRHLDRCLAATVFKGPPSRIIKAYKDGGERRLAPVIAELLLAAALEAEAAAPDRYGGIISGADGVVFVPSTAEAYRRRGFDHMEGVARPFAERSGVLLMDALVKHGSADQRALGREERHASSEGAFETVLNVEGLRLLLLDDVVTTGSTVDAAARALKDAGAVHVDVLALARVW